MHLNNYNFPCEDIFHIITSGCYYMVMQYVFVHQPPLAAAHRRRSSSNISLQLTYIIL